MSRAPHRCPAPRAPRRPAPRCGLVLFGALLACWLVAACLNPRPDDFPVVDDGSSSTGSGGSGGLGNGADPGLAGSLGDFQGEEGDGPSEPAAEPADAGTDAGAADAGPPKPGSDAAAEESLVDD